MWITTLQLLGEITRNVKHLDYRVRWDAHCSNHCLQAESQPPRQSDTNTETINSNINKEVHIWESQVLLFQTAFCPLSRVGVLNIFLLDFAIFLVLLKQPLPEDFFHRISSCQQNIRFTFSKSIFTISQVLKPYSIKNTWWKEFTGPERKRYKPGICSYMLNS